MTEWYDAEGHRQVKNSYDGRSRVIRQLDANGNEAALAYFDDHTVVTDAAGKVSEVWFDAQGRTTKTVDANGAEIRYAYDERSNITAITDALGNTTRYEYDAAGNKTKETAPDGSSYSLVYDENNSLTQLTDQLGGVTRYTYNLAGNLLSMIDGSGNETRYAYDCLGNIIAVGDSNGITRYSYDALNRINAITDPQGAVTRYEYDAIGNLISDSEDTDESISATQVASPIPHPAAARKVYSYKPSTPGSYEKAQKSLPHLSATSSSSSFFGKIKNGLNSIGSTLKSWGTAISNAANSAVNAVKRIFSGSGSQPKNTPAPQASPKATPQPTSAPSVYTRNNISFSGGGGSAPAPITGWDRGRFPVPRRKQQRPLWDRGLWDRGRFPVPRRKQQMNHTATARGANHSPRRGFRVL